MHYKVTVNSLEGIAGKLALKAEHLHDVFTLERCKQGKIPVKEGEGHLLVDLEEIDEECDGEKCTHDKIKYIKNECKDLLILTSKEEK